MPDGLYRVLFVCLGNICRSPLAEGLLQKKVDAAGLSDRVLVDSAGTGGWHVGAPPDARMTATAAAHGADLSALKARRLEAQDLAEFDLVLTMDDDNLRDTRALASAAPRAEVRPFRDFDPEPGDGQVPDPYYGGDAGFEHVYAIADRTTDALLDHVARAVEASGGG